MTASNGLVRWDFAIPVTEFTVPVYEAHPATGRNHPITLIIRPASTSRTAPIDSQRWAITLFLKV
jgi:hypothetical protein